MSVQELITASAQKYGVDPNLALSVAKTESSLNPHAVSSVGAIGVMQLMPSSFPGVNIWDTGTNIDTGVQYLAQMLNRYGDTATALAAYNAGPGNVDRYGGIPPFAETQSYVDKVLGWFNASGGSSLVDQTVTDIVDANSVDSVFGTDTNTLVMVAGVGIILGLLVENL